MRPNQLVPLPVSPELLPLGQFETSLFFTLGTHLLPKPHWVISLHRAGRMSRGKGKLKSLDLGFINIWLVAGVNFPPWSDYIMCCWEVPRSFDVRGAKARYGSLVNHQRFEFMYFLVVFQQLTLGYFRNLADMIFHSHCMKAIIFRQQYNQPGGMTATAAWNSQYAASI